MNPGIIKVSFGKGYTNTAPIKIVGTPHSVRVCPFGGRAKLVFHNTKVCSDSSSENSVLTEAVQAWEDPDQFNVLVDITPINTFFILRHMSETHAGCDCGEHASPHDLNPEARLKSHPHLWKKLEGRLQFGGFTDINFKPFQDGINKIISYEDTLASSYEEALKWYDEKYYSAAEPGSFQPSSMEISVSRMLDTLPDPEATLPCPVEDCSEDRFQQATQGISTSRNLQYAIMHLNDEHQWTREAIADWLELEAQRQGFSLTFPVPEA